MCRLRPAAGRRGLRRDVAPHDWGHADPPHPAAAAAAAAGRGGRSELEPPDLPEVRKLAADGWELAPDAPMYVFLPSVWPRHLRTWVPDRATRYATNWRSSPDEPLVKVPWDDDLRRELEADANRDLAHTGIAPRPPGRLWLLRPPPDYAGLQELLQALGQRARARGIDQSCNPAFAAFIAAELQRLGSAT